MEIELIIWKRELMSSKDRNQENLEMIQVEEERELRSLKYEGTIRDISNSIRKTTIRKMGIPEGREG